MTCSKGFGLNREMKCHSFICDTDWKNTLRPLAGKFSDHCFCELVVPEPCPMKYIWARTEESEEGDDDVFSCHVAVKLLRYFSFIRDGLSPDGPRSISFLLEQLLPIAVLLVWSLFQEWEKYIGLEILKRHFSRRPVKEVAGNSNFLWLSVNPCVFSLGVNVL